MKTCSKCNISKADNNFYSYKGSKKLCAECKECALKRSKTNYTRNKEYIRTRSASNYVKNKDKKAIVARNTRLRKKYNIDIIQYNELLIKQNGCCAICKTNDPKKSNRQTNYFSVDHCHTTGKVRGLLCTACNVSLGMLQDNISYLNNAIDYLKINNNNDNTKENSNILEFKELNG